MARECEEFKLEGCEAQQAPALSWRKSKPGLPTALRRVQFTMRNSLLLELCDPAHQEVVTGLLRSNQQRIAVPCSLLSKGANGTGSKVVVNVIRAQGCNVALDCGKWWRGAPTTAVYIDYRQASALALAAGSCEGGWRRGGGNGGSIIGRQPMPRLCILLEKRGSFETEAAIEFIALPTTPICLLPAAAAPCQRGHSASAAPQAGGHLQQPHQGARQDAFGAGTHPA